MIQFACSSCQAQLSVSDHKAGHRGKCPKCEAVIEVPSAPAAVDPPEEDTGVIPLAAAPGDEEQAALPRIPAAVPISKSATGLVVTSIDDIAVVNFQAASILDATIIQAIGSELFALVDQKAMRKIVLDFGMVKFLSSQMLGVLLTMHKKSAAIRGQLVLCGLRPELLKVFSIMRLEKILTIVDDEPKAVELLGFRASA